MAYRIEIPSRVKKEIAKLSTENQRRVTAEIDKLAENPRHAGCKKLVGLPHYRVRAGDYRILYNIEDEDSHRGESQKQRRSLQPKAVRSFLPIRSPPSNI